MNRATAVVSLLATLTLGVGLGGAVTHFMAHVEVTCPVAAQPQVGAIPPGFFNSMPLPLTGKQY